MSKPSVSSEAVAQDQLRSYFERWQRLEEEKRAISDDLKELFAEAKGFGFNTKVMRKLFRDETGDYSERMEFEAIYELYATALGTPVATHARPARPIPTPPASQETTAADPAEGVIASSAEPLQEGSEPIEAHNLDRAGSTPAPATNTLADSPTAEKGDKPESDTLGKVAGQIATHHGGSGAIPETAAAPVAEGVSPNASSVTPTAADNARKIRPWCLHADDLSKCGGFGRVHCHPCLKAHADAEGIAA